MSRQAKQPVVTEQIITSLQSATTTNTTTFEQLQVLLGCKSARATIEIKAKVKSTKENEKPPKRRPGAVVKNVKKDIKIKDKPSLQIYEGDSSVVQPLPAGLRHKFATEVFNSSLKCLAQGVKTRQTSDDVNPGQNRLAEHKLKAKPKPLQPVTGNAQPENTVKTCSRDDVGEDYTVTADCAIIALDCLRQLNTDSGSEVDSETHKLRKAALVLIEKLISLGLPQQSLSEATKVYEQYWKRRKSTPQSVEAAEKQGQIPFIPIRVASEQDESVEKDLGFISSYQSQVLRLAILLGSKVVNTSFISDVKMEQLGSPANVILRGLKSGQLDSQKASQQLRTISQALLKLYSISSSDKSQRETRSELNFELLMEALLIKCKFWSVSNHKAEFEHELWPHVLKGLRRLEVDSGNNLSSTFQLVHRCITSIASSIHDSDAKTNIPFETICAIVDISEKADRHTDGLKMLRQSEVNIATLSSENRMLLYWRMTTLHHKSSGTYDAAFSGMLDATATITHELQPSDVVDIDNLLLHGARLRKTIIAVLTTLAARSNESSSLETELSVRCLSVLSDLSQLLFRTSQSNDLMSDLKKQAYSITSFAKIFEAVIEVEENKAPQLASYQGEYDLALQQCVSSAKILIEEDKSHAELKAVLESLLARASHLYWLRYANYIDSNDRETNSIRLLELCCTPISDVSTKVQKSASFGIKLEKLALAHLMAKNIRRSCDLFEDVIRYYIRLGSLQEATEAALSGPSCHVWSRQGTSSYSLSKALASLVRLRLTHNLESTATCLWAYDDENLQPIERCLLFENQMVVLVDHELSHSQSESFIHACEEMFSLISGSQYCVYRIRFLGSILRILAKNDSISSTSFLSLIATKYLLEASSHRLSSTALSAYAETTLLIVRIQYLMCSESVDVSALERFTSELSSVVTALTDKTALDCSIDDLKFVINQLQAVCDVGQMLDDTRLVVSPLLCIQHILAVAAPDNLISRAENLTQLASIYHRTGDCVRSRRAFEAAAQLLTGIPQDTAVYRKWALFYVQYLMDTSQVQKAIHLYGDLTTNHESGKSLEERSSRDRLQNEFLLSMAAQVASHIAFSRGDISLYTRYARQSIDLSTRIWHVIERSYNGLDTKPVTEGNSSIYDLSEEMTALTISPKTPEMQSKPTGSAYWLYIHSHCSILHHIIDVSIHDGLYKDARCYADQLLKVATMTGSRAREVRALSISALVHAKAGHDIHAIEQLESCRSSSNICLTVEDQYSLLLQAESFVELRQSNEAMALLNDLQRVLNQKSVEESAKPELSGIQKPPVRGKAKVTRPIKAPPKRSVRPAATVADSAPKSIGSGLTHRQQLIHQKSQALRNLIGLTEKGVPSAVLSMSDMEQADGNCTEFVVTKSMLMLQQAFTDLSSDAVKCVLDEAAVALPVRYRSSRKSGRVSFLQAGNPQSVSNGKVKGRPRVVASKKSASKEQLSSGEQLVLGAQKLLDGLYQAYRQTSASDLLHLTCKLQSKIALLSSILDAPFTMSSSELVLRSLSPKDIVQDREHAIINAERSTRQKAQLLTWPAINTPQDHHSTSMMGDYNMDDLADIPETWSILTISLADNQKELLLSRTVAGRSPFLLRVPLSRSDFDADEEEFTFADARSELHEIMAEANASAHDTRGQGDREARKAWYADREVLDQRLEAWLSNVENIWLGGFRGLMTSEYIDEELLTKFGQLLDKVLDKHLPSRQKMSGSKTNKIVLHAHVLELFLGLGNPDEQEIDDAAMDLLYFVVDILQFSGEQNAYDEIDFDAMLIDLFDAMRSYHNLRSQERSMDSHTILVVDKEIASFPWESLPCLRSQSVSRMPSLTSIFSRLKKIRQQSSSAQGYSIAVERGSFILNPSSDLSSTQKTFQPIFEAQLPMFTSVVNRKPSESDFTSLLTDNDLLLYFGHGSGAQYIRGRTIRNLESCAVTLLMGCSSAHMTECGKFESHGMPGYYIGGMSGCMAVVGTLWDVTDRDIDRFALKTMLEWGLIEEDEMVATGLERSKKKNKIGSSGKSGPAKNRKGVFALDDAVRRGRDACLLRYLNGAAPVIYGVPVFLR